MMSSAQIPIMIGSDKATQTIIAPVQHDLIAVQPYAVKDLFIFNNGLYKVTTAISQGGTIVIGTSASCNAQAASTLSEEIDAKINKSVFRSGDTITSGQDYACPNDGYIYIYIKGNQEMDVLIYDSIKSRAVRKDIINAAASGIYDALFVKKGMIINCNYTSTKGELYFVPFI